MSGDAGDANGGTNGDAEYVFTVRIRIDPVDPDVRVEPADTVLYKQAAQPGEDGWLLFRDNLWRGEINDPEHARTLVEEALGVDVERVSFRELRTDEAYFEALKAAVGENLDLFRADDTTEALHKYLGSSVHVRDR